MITTKIIIPIIVLMVRDYYNFTSAIILIIILIIIGSTCDGNCTWLSAVFILPLQHLHRSTN
ncbi:hypothetical protein BDV41DRAFT_535603 [Aspergillus transmontanensis]|uniref:Uncharacterized protein n=1 Tax=Aspergillus transmontanensis TaxID=1034304 RepID=A0A5N6W172_9EURO|nr:hypothetical protein BDV41DRAFT_535603 [Aspergillus transmontanensis]